MRTHDFPTASTGPRLTLALFLLCMAGATTAQDHEDTSPAGKDGRCRFLCAPELKIEPTFSFEPLFQRPLVETLDGGEVVSRTRQERESGFELVLALGIPTTVPRMGFTFEVILKPFEEVDNEPEVELELNLYIVESEQTGGWIESHFDVVDKISPSERPGDERAYTHKLNLEWDTAVRPFNRLPADRYLAHVELEVSLDYVATGLPRAGDVIGEERFVTGASPWSVSLLLVFPVAPLWP